MKYTVQDYMDGKIVIEKTTDEDMVEVMKLSGRELDGVYGYPNSFEKYYWKEGNVCKSMNYEVFPSDYPVVKASNLLWAPKVGERVLVWDDCEIAEERIFLGKFDGRYLCVDRNLEDYYKSGECFKATSWKNCKPISKEELKEFTLQEIADKMGIPVEQLRIKK